MITGGELDVDKMIKKTKANWQKKKYRYFINNKFEPIIRGSQAGTKKGLTLRQEVYT